MALHKPDSSFSAFGVMPALEIRRSAASGEIEGYAVSFGGPPNGYNEIVARGAFTRTLAEHAQKGTMPLMLWGHDLGAILGRWTDMQEDDFGLKVRGILNMDTTRGRDAYAHVQAGDIDGLSIGFVARREDRVANEDGSKTLKHADLVEVSLTGYPADKRARLKKPVNLRSKKDLVEHLQGSGLAKMAAVRVAAGGWPALAGGEEDKATALLERIAERTEKLRSLK